MIPELDWILIGLPCFIVAGTVHEYMHAWTAKKLGDYTATVEGRLSLNPLVHLDLFGFILMVVARFGWMKPVSVNSYNFKNPVAGMALTALAGPASNLVMAIVGAVLYNLFFSGIFFNFVSLDNIFMYFFQSLFYFFIYVNLVLMLFNLIPIPPLDGSRIVKVIMPKRFQHYWDMLENYSGIMILLILLPISPLSILIGSYLTTSLSFFMRLLIL